MATWGPDLQRATLSKFGYTGDVGSGQGNAFLTANPQYINAYTAERRKVDPNFTFVSQGLQPNQGGVAPVGQVEPLNSVQKSALDYYANASPAPYENRANGYFDSIAGMYGQVNPMIQGAVKPLDGASITQYMNPYNEQVIQNSIADMQRVADVERNRINSNVPGSRSYGDSSGAIQNSELARNLLTTTGNTSGTLRAQGYDTAVNNINTDKNRQLTGATSLQQLLALGSDLGGQQKGYADQTVANKLAAGTTIQNQNQKLLDVLKPEIATKTNYDLSQLSTLLSLLNQFPTNSLSTGRAYESPGYLGAISKSAQGALNIASAFSDSRIKHNVKFKEIKNGFNVYEFSYIGSNKRFTGVMAQEVEQIIPEAVHHINGIKAVNYSMINVPFSEVTHGIG